jgi:hypothetical protein
MTILSSVIIGSFIVAALAVIVWYVWKPRFLRRQPPPEPHETKTPERAEPPPHAMHQAHNHERDLETGLTNANSPAPSGSIQKGDPGVNTTGIPATSPAHGEAAMRAFVDRYTIELNRKASIGCKDIRRAWEVYLAHKDIWQVNEAQLENIMKEYAWKNIGVIRLMSLRRLGLEFHKNDKQCLP